MTRGALVHIGSSLGLVPANLGFFKEPPGSAKITNLDEEGIVRYLTEERKNGFVSDFSFIYAKLDSTMLNADESFNEKMVIELGSADSGTARSVAVYGVQENLLESSASQLYKVDEQTDACAEVGLIP